MSTPCVGGSPKSVISRRGFISSHLREGGLGTLVEPVKYEPRETACRMAEGDMSLRTGIKSFVVEIKNIC